MSKYIRRGLNWYSGLWPKRIFKPPYAHIVQVGDPVLRTKCESIPIPAITFQETKNIVTALKEVMQDYQCVGIAAPQIGINKRIFLMEMNENQMKGHSEKFICEQQMFIFPLMVFINPTMKIVNYKKINHIEACESIKGYCAEVPRYQEVQINGYNEEGTEVSINFGGWSSRIAQHEMDHLDGKIYTDVMNKETFACQFWKEININQGRIRLPFSPE